jgi:hypothetical protein
LVRKEEEDKLIKYREEFEKKRAETPDLIDLFDDLAEYLKKFTSIGLK